jgi:type IV fimbrial biogenesis protein FimT
MHAATPRQRERRARLHAAKGSAGCRARAGFTLVELAVMLAIGGLLLGLALPQYHDWIAEYRLLNFARDLAGSMNEARSEAIKRNMRVNLCKSADRRSCSTTGDWSQGFVMYIDSDRDGDVDAGEVALRVVEPAARGISARGNRPVADYVSYTSMGTARLVSGALQMGTLTVCLRGQKALDVVLANSGRARIQKTATVCP